MKRNLWPCAITLYFIVFITGVVTWIVFATRHQDQLVSPDYYEHEMRFQEQIDRAKRGASNHENTLSFDANEQSLVVHLSGSSKIAGSIHLYRPSDSRLDRRAELDLNNAGTQTLDLSKLKSGLWRASVTWTAADRDYYLEKTIVVRGQ
jgi:nitrogen fixation protein FixH